LGIPSARAEGLGTLIEVGRAQADIQAAYEEETRAFERVSNAVERGAIKKGDLRDDILKKYGKPVVKLDNKENGREKWVYKPAKSTFFKGIRISIFFNSGGAVDEIAKEEP